MSHFTTAQSEDISFVALEQGHRKTCRSWDGIDKLSRGSPAKDWFITMITDFESIGFQRQPFK
jgi:hypothetical protein